MGCVTSEADNKSGKRRTTQDLSNIRDSLGNPLDDVEAAKRKDKK